MARLLEAAPGALVDVSVQALLLGSAFDLTTEVTEVECQMSTLEGGRVAVSISSKILCDRQAEPIGLVLVARDVREVVELRRRLVTSNRLAAVGELAAGIAHEINNPLAYVRSNLSLLRRHWQDIGVEIPDMRAPGRAAALLAEGTEIIDESLQGVDQAVAIVRDVKGLSHAAQSELEMADVNALLDGVARMAASQLPRSVKIAKHYAAVPSIRCAPQELQQVFLNLAMNAGQALGESGEIRLITDLDGETLVVRIEDDGCGIPPEVADRIFDPFFTTKAVGEGTGLGLGIALDIVRRHGGSIEAESSPGDGTCFLVRLPVDIDRMEPHSQRS
jgi:signal transduction histidine kinase